MLIKVLLTYPSHLIHFLVLESRDEIPLRGEGCNTPVLSKVVEFKDFTLFRGITTQDVKGHLLELKMATGRKNPQIRGYRTRWAWIRVWVYARGHGRGYNFKPNGYLLTGFKI